MYTHYSHASYHKQPEKSPSRLPAAPPPHVSGEGHSIGGGVHSLLAAHRTDPLLVRAIIAIVKASLNLRATNTTTALVGDPGTAAILLCCGEKAIRLSGFNPTHGHYIPRASFPLVWDNHLGELALTRLTHHCPHLLTNNNYQLCEVKGAQFCPSGKKVSKSKMPSSIE